MELSSVKKCLVEITAFLLVIACLVFYLFDVLKTAFLYNIHINSVILLCFLTGVIVVYLRLFSYSMEFNLISVFDRLGKADIEKFKILKPITLYISKNNKLLSQQKLQTIMSGIEKNIYETESFSKYLSGILVFLGLLGTFWGLSHTIGNVASIIDNLGIDQADSAESFLKLKNSLKIPLSGMGIAFGCSLMGLATSLILGFLNINLRRASSDFENKIETWLSRKTISFDSVDNNASYHGEIFSMGLLEKSIETMYAFQNQLSELEGNRVSLFNMQRDISHKLSQLTEAMTVNQETIKTLCVNQNQMQSINTSLLGRMGEVQWDDIIKRLNSTENALNAIIKNSSNDRDYLIENINREIRMISKTLSSIIEKK